MTAVASQGATETRGSAAVGESLLEARHLQKSYGSRKVVKDVSLVVRKGEVVGLLGPNGAGKTTSFYMIVGLLPASAGDIRIDGQSIEHMPIHRRARLGLGYLPQETSIFRKLNVQDNVRAVLELQRDAQGKSLSEATIAERLKETQQMSLLLGGPADLDVFFKRQVALWGGVVREHGIKAN